MRMKIVGALVVAGVGALCWALAWATNALAADEVGAGAAFGGKGVVRVGVLAPLTGAFARYGEKFVAAVRGEANGSVQFVFEDEGCDPKRAIDAFKRLSEVDGVRVFLGPWCGSPQSAVAPLVRSKNDIAVLGSSAPRAVWAASGDRMFSTQHSIEDESEFMAGAVARRGAKSVVIVFRENQFSRAHEAAFRAAFPGAVLETIAYDSGDISELKSAALRIRKLNPDALYVPDAFPLLGGFTKELRAIGLGGKPVYSVYSAQSEDVMKTVGSDGGLVYSFPDIGEEEAIRTFPRNAARLLVAAIGLCGDDPTCLQAKLRMSGGFDSNGVVPAHFVLKTLRHERFEVLEDLR